MVKWFAALREPAELGDVIVLCGFVTGNRDSAGSQ